MLLLSKGSCLPFGFLFICLIEQIYEWTHIFSVQQPPRKQIFVLQISSLIQLIDFRLKEDSDAAAETVAPLALGDPFSQVNDAVLSENREKPLSSLLPGCDIIKIVFQILASYCHSSTFSNK